MHFQVGDSKDVWLPFDAAAEDGANAGEQLREGKRLGQVIVGPEVQTPNPVLHLTAASEAQDRGLAMGLAKLFQDPPAAAIG
jgi:hypothetical protein